MVGYLLLRSMIHTGLGAEGLCGVQRVQHRQAGVLGHSKSGDSALAIRVDKSNGLLN